MQRHGRWMLGALALFVASCGGGAQRLPPTFVAVHNAMSAMGLSSAGPISEGSLPAGGDARVARHFAAGECVTLVALGTDDVQDLDLRVVDDTGTELGRDATHDRQAATQVCPSAGGDYTVVVHMAQGQGGYTLAAWAGGGAGGAVASGEGGNHRSGGRGTCAQPIRITPGQPVQGDTRQGPVPGTLTGRCAEGPAPEQVYLLHVDARSTITASLSSTYDAVLYLQRTCGDVGSELACNDDVGQDTSRSELGATLDRGDYYLVVDGYDQNAGTYELVVQTAPTPPIEALCGDAAPLTPGRPTTGTTLGQADSFTATCADGAHSPDRVYKLHVAARSRARLRLTGDHDGALYVRSDCTNPSSEVACNDDFGDQQHSVITTVLDPGDYYVYVDGFGTSAAGNFTLETELAPDTGGTASGDRCTSPGTLTPGQPMSFDTIGATDDGAGSCGGQGAPDLVQRIDVRSRARLRVTFRDAELDGVAYLQRTCGDASTEVLCVPFGPSAQTAGLPPMAPSMPPMPSPMPGGGPGPGGPGGPGNGAPPPAAIDTVLAQGSYYLVIDGARAGAFGAVAADVQLDDLAALDRTCHQAPILQPGHTVSGNTTPSTDRFQASCAGGAQSNDDVYRIQLQRRSTVRLTLSASYDGALFLRRDCTDQTSELACNDDSTDNHHSYLEATLDRGTYYVVVDGFRTGNVGSYTLDMQAATAF